MKRIIILFFLVVIYYSSYAGQIENYKFSKITTEELSKKSYDIDLSASAIILADVGITEMEGTNQGWFQITQKRKCRIKILTKDGYDAANISVLLHDRNGYRDRIVGIRGVTYNLVNNVIVETKLSDENIFTEKLNKYNTLKKLSFPQVKEGSIIEFSYTLSTDNIFLLLPWQFQHKYPCLYSENKTSIPEFFSYTPSLIGIRNFDKVNEATSSKTYTILVSENDAYGASNRVELSSAVNDRQLIMLNVPAYREEKFISAEYNYISRIVFQLNSYKFPNSPLKNTIKTWSALSEILMEDEEFGKEVYNNNTWLSPYLTSIIQNTNSDEEKAKVIYTYLQKNYLTTDANSMYLSKNLRTIFNEKKGGFADLNLLLVAMLRNINLDAAPVIVKPKENGYPNPRYPFLQGYDYVLCHLKIDSTTYLLDVSDKNLPFGQLKLNMYNGMAHAIAKQDFYIELTPEKIKEQSRTVYELSYVNNELQGKFTYTPGMYESYSLRNSTAKEITQELLSKNNTIKEYTIDTNTIEISGLTNLEEDIIISYKFKIPFNNEQLFLNSLLTKSLKENPFLTNNRVLPFELPYKIDENVILSMQLPSNLAIDEIPKSVKSSFNIDEGSYDFIVRSNASMIQIKSKLQIHKTNFNNTESKSLMEFFDLIIAKNSEKVVLKKL